MSRFDCPSAPLALRSLVMRSRRPAWSALALGVIVHLSLSLLVTPLEQGKTVRPLTMQFIKRQPRLTKPLELKKRPRPKRRQVRRQTLMLKAKAHRGQAVSRLRPAVLLRGVAKPPTSVKRWMADVSTAFGCQARAREILAARESKSAVDMSLELMDIEALDTGQYQAVVIQDPADKRNIKGFFHIVVIYSKSIQDAALRLEAAGVRQLGSVNVMQLEVAKLVEAVNRYTRIRMDIAGTYSMDSPEFLKTPWVLVESLTNFDVSRSEAENIGYYLTHGGFLFAENDYFTLGNAADLSLRNMFVASMSAARLTHGRHWLLQKVPNEHPLYHCYFDFDGPPAAHDCLYADQPRPGGVVRPLDYLEGIFVAGQLVAIHSNKDISDWWLFGMGSTSRIDNTRQLQFGVNTIVYALTREGSITNRLMESVAR